MTLFKLILLAVLICAEARVQIFVTDTPVERVGSRIYKKILLTDKFQNPKELAYESASRNLFFMYMDDRIQDSARAYVNIGTKEASQIYGIKRNKAISVDYETGDVYFGSNNGLYKYDPIRKEAVHIGLYNVNIIKLVIRNNEMFLLDANTHQIYKVMNVGKTTVKVADIKTVMEFEVDNERNIHAVSMSGVYCVVGGHEVIKNKDLSVVYHFIVDADKVYGLSEHGIYDINCSNGTAILMSRLAFVPNGITFGDYGDIFYSIDNQIYRLTPIRSYRVFNLNENQH